MCNKCEVTHELPQHEVPSTPMLTTWAHLNERAKDYAWDSSTRNHSMRQFLSGQHQYENAEYWSHARMSWVKDKREYSIPQGRKTAQLKSAADKLATRDVTTIVDFLPIRDYLKQIHYINRMTAEKIEPQYVSVARKETDWERLDLINKLHPYISGDFDNAAEAAEKQSMYHDSNNNFNMLNLLHMVHISVEDINQIAYYPTLDHMRRGREVRTRLGRYLTKYQTALGLTDHDVKSMTEKHVANMRARGGWAVDFIENNDADGWLEVYRSENINSCMQGEDAVRIYAHDKSELRLAHVKAGDKYIARCIVRDDPDGEMTGWLRVYPDPNGYAEGRYLLDYLKVNGYPNQTNLDGALLRYINDGSGIVCPYLDYGNGGDQTVSVVLRDGKQYLEAGGGELDATLTGGYANDNMCDCAICGDRMDEDDSNWIEYDDQRVCDYCRDEHYTYAMGARYEDYFPADECVEVRGTWYFKDTISEHDEVGYCEIDEEYYHIDDLVCTCDGMYHERHVTAIDHEDSEGYTYCLDTKVHTLSDGTTCHEDDAEQYEADLTEAVA